MPGQGWIICFEIAPGSISSPAQVPVVSTYLHNDSFPADHPLWMGPLGYQGSKAAMNTIAKVCRYL